MFNIPHKKDEVATEKKEKPIIDKFIIVSQDCSGVGLAKMLKSGVCGKGNPRNPHKTKVIFSVKLKEDEDNEECLYKVGEGLFDLIPFGEIWKKRKDYKDWLFVWDYNFASDEAEQLRKEGFMVFGGLKLSDMMEHDRDFGLSLIKKIGMPLPEYKEFNDVNAGLDYLDCNENVAYVFKPDEPDNKSWVTTCPDHDNDPKANREIYNFLKSHGKGKGEYILQERKKGVEINIEAFVYMGQIFFAQANFESKRKYNGDYGKMIGCAQDTCFVVPIDCKIIKDTLLKLSILPEFKDYVGFLDMNLIVADNEYWFLEFCGRFGYNAHYTLFSSVAISPLNEILSDWVLGNLDGFTKHFRHGFGASVSCMIDDPVCGLPISFDNETDESKFLPYDTYVNDEGEACLAGYSNEVGVVTAHDYDIKSACEEAVDRFKRVHYPGKAGRTDLAHDDYLSNPRERYIACMAMRLFDRY